DEGPPGRPAPDAHGAAPGEPGCRLLPRRAARRDLPGRPWQLLAGPGRRPAAACGELPAAVPGDPENLGPPRGDGAAGAGPAQAAATAHGGPPAGVSGADRPG